MTTLSIPSQTFGARKTATGPSLWARARNFASDHRRRAADRAIERYVAGRRWSDSCERDIDELIARGDGRF
ncbi:MAG: hypothetical protein KGL46_06335 [Hyphomicrobiales bacterium]|nr:hypothetical protein [Hyphomicrobiales bacterium]